MSVMDAPDVLRTSLPIILNIVTNTHKLHGLISAYDTPVKMSAAMCLSYRDEQLIKAALSIYYNNRWRGSGVWKSSLLCLLNLYPSPSSFLVGAQHSAMG